MTPFEARDLQVYRGPRRVVCDVSLSAHAGEILAVIGPNGAGKSTLLKALVGLLPSQGQILLGGEALARLSRKERATRLGYVPQQTLLASGLSVEAVVAQGRFAQRGSLSGVLSGTLFGRLAAASCDEVLERALLRTDLSSLRRRAFDTLSGGEQRRVLLARALATEAKVLFLDEPTAGLDIAHVLRFFEILHGLSADGYAVFTVLHDLASVRRHATRVLLLDRGCVVLQDSTAQVFASPELERVYGVRMREQAGLDFSLAGDPA